MPPRSDWEKDRRARQSYHYEETEQDFGVMSRSSDYDEWYSGDDDDE
jgi:hypothetical protein